MTKQQIIDAVATTTERPKAEVETAVDSLLGEIGKALRSGERVDLHGFGSFAVKDKKARQGRNPKTGETIQIAARKAATFKPSKELSDKLAAESLATTGQADPRVVKDMESATTIRTRVRTARSIVATLQMIILAS